MDFFFAEFGFGKQSMTSVIEDEAKEIFQSMGAATTGANNKDFKVEQTFIISISLQCTLENCEREAQRSNIRVVYTV